MKALRKVGRRVGTAVLGEERVLEARDRWNERKLRSHLGKPDGRANANQLEQFRDRHKGERCFIIGNGPSLRDMDLSPLRDEHTFGLNRIYLMFPKIGFSTEYLVCVNRFVLEQAGQEIAETSSEKFIRWTSRDSLPRRPDIHYVYPRTRPGFYADVPHEGVWEGATVTYVAMQLAFFMGFQTAILIGVDHNFETKGEPHKLVTSTGGDPNHFDPNYFGKGFKWQLPDLETSEIAYRKARREFEASGREILDATVNGKLQVFPKVRYTELV